MYDCRLWLLCLLAVTAGCSDSNPLDRQPVSGHVTWVGQPLTEATIRFEPMDARTKVEAGAQIVDGHYEIAAEQGLLPGTYRVIISALRDTGQSQSTMGQRQPIRSEVLPAAYNRQSTLQVELADGEQAEFDFTLAN